MTSILRRWWHRHKIRVLQEMLDVATAEIPLLEKAEREYASSYYTDKLRDAVCRRMEAASGIAYHNSKLKEMT